MLGEKMIQITADVHNAFFIVIVLWGMVLTLAIHQKNLTKRLLRDDKDLHWLDWSLMRNLSRITMSLFYLSVFILGSLAVKAIFLK